MQALLRRHVQINTTTAKGLIRNLAIQSEAADARVDGVHSPVERSFISLREPLPGVKQPSYLPDYIRPAETFISTLPNGLQIGSQNFTDPCTSVGLVVDCGCIYEEPNTYGASHLLEKMAFNSTKNRMKARLGEEVQAIGLNLTSSSARDQMIYMASGIKTFLPQILEILVDSVRNAAFEESEVQEKLLLVKEELEGKEDNPESLLLGALHSVGYTGDYAKSFWASPSSVATLNGGVLREFVDRNFTASRMVLSAAGVDHHELLAVAEPLLADIPKRQAPPSPQFNYVGGEWRKSDDSPVTHFAVAFEVPKGWQNERLVNRLSVLKFLLGGGQRFSVGGPGKGMYTRLYDKVMNKMSGFHSISAFSSIYNHTGLFGVYACADSDFTSQAVDTTCKELLSIISEGQVTEKEFQRAKNATISAALISLESKVVVAEDIACQIMSCGQRRPVSSFVAEIRDLTLKDVQNAAREVFATPLTVVSLGGAADKVPTYSSMVRRFKC